MGNAGALHGDRHAGGADLAIRQHFAARGVIPVDQLFAFQNAAVQSAAQDVLVIGDRFFTFANDVLQTQFSRIDTECIRQFIDDGFDKERTLCRAIATESASRHFVGVDDFG